MISIIISRIENAVSSSIAAVDALRGGHVGRAFFFLANAVNPDPGNLPG